MAEENAFAQAKLLALVDRSSVEIFVNDGEQVITSLIFPNPSSSLPPAAIRSCSLTRSTPVTSSVTGCSTWILDRKSVV